ncbi:hypothetical protein BKA56DRAFT_588469 [Ilyonectria sp. MPI-CAGE-AT-0026]|nr:hypothetical protein BKA56DRAFT_588469 [Ilyonectria sp. MPI-CAGE-AT-0026]
MFRGPVRVSSSLSVSFFFISYTSNLTSSIKYRVCKYQDAAVFTAHIASSFEISLLISDSAVGECVFQTQLAGRHLNIACVITPCISSRLPA